MRKRGFLSVFPIILGTVSVLMAQGLSVAVEPGITGRERSVSQCFTPPYCSDAKLNDIGEPINRDYFTADEEKDSRQLLHLVEAFHTTRVLPQISENDWVGALNDIKYTLNRFPNHPRGLLLMGLYSRLSKRQGLAVPYYEKAIRLYPQYALTYAQYGAYMVTVGDVDGGIKKLERAVEMNPDLVFAHVSLAAAYRKMGNMELSRRAESKARESGYRGNVSVESLNEAQPGK